MIDLPSVKFRKTYDDFCKYTKFNCGDISSLVAFWVLQQNLNNGSPVYIVTQSTNTWDHTVCEIKGIGTLDGRNNLYIPDYYYHKEPITDQQFFNAKPVFNWFSTQLKTINAKKFLSYNTKEIINTNLLLFGDYTSFSTKMEIL